MSSQCFLTTTKSNHICFLHTHMWLSIYIKKMSCDPKNGISLFLGNIRVFCRVRPISQDEKDAADARILLSFDSDDDSILYLSSKGKVMTFELDKVFPPQATQEEVNVTADILCRLERIGRDA